MEIPAYEELTKIVRAYAAAGADASLDNVSKSASINPTIISKNNKFLVATGIIQGGHKKTLTPQGEALAKALDYEMPHDIERGWREVVTANDFFDKVVSAVRIRRGMDIGALRTHIAYTAGEKKGPGTMTGAGAVINILRAASLIEEADGKIVGLFREFSGVGEAGLYEPGGWVTR